MVSGQNEMFDQGDYIFEETTYFPENLAVCCLVRATLADKPFSTICRLISSQEIL